MAPKRRTASRVTSRSRSRSRSQPTKKKAAATRAATPEQRGRSESPDASVVEEAYFRTENRRFTPEKDTWNGKYEFGGTLGVLGIMIFSHIIILYFYVCIDRFQGTLVYPGHAVLGGQPMHKVFQEHLVAHACPTVKTFAIFFGFLFVQYVLAVVLPGICVKGLPLPSENGYRLSYKCNAVSSWYCILLLAAALHYTEVFPLQALRKDFGRYLMTATIAGDLLSVVCYITGKRRQIRMTPSFLYNFFMGSALNYRLPGNVDVKLFAECRNSWVLLMLLTLGCAAEQYKQQGWISGNMAFMILAHLLYVNAVQKGEECVITTWDICYEKFGWMLAYWNTCGVPFLYCMQSMYIQTVLKEKQHPRWVLALMVVTLLFFYYVWDTMNSQKNRFRMRRSGVPMSIIKRRTFPQLPWSYIENPRTLKSSKGELFVDGWYRYGRKLHYTVDLCMALLWGCACGFQSAIPFFYFFFFLSHLVDRVGRDEKRCRAKYGKLWDEYLKSVPYKFIPYVY